MKCEPLVWNKGSCWQCCGGSCCEQEAISVKTTAEQNPCWCTALLQGQAVLYRHSFWDDQWIKHRSELILLALSLSKKTQFFDRMFEKAAKHEYRDCNPNCSGWKAFRSRWKVSFSSVFSQCAVPQFPSDARFGRHLCMSHSIDSSVSRSYGKAPSQPFSHCAELWHTILVSLEF